MAQKTRIKFLLTAIAICNRVITDCDMLLGEKLRYLREVEGTLRGLDRELSQVEMARLIQKELGKSISQSYLSQIEGGTRPHLTNSTRMLLARFFKVHPGYLVDGSAHLHLPHLHLHHGMHLGHAHGGHGAAGKGGPSWFNIGTLAAFLAWFGGTGYLLEHYYSVWFAAALGVATLSGLGGASV